MILFFAEIYPECTPVFSGIRSGYTPVTPGPPPLDPCETLVIPLFYPDPIPELPRVYPRFTPGFSLKKYPCDPYEEPQKEVSAMKNKLKRVLALLLSVMMIGSELSGLITPARAAENPETLATQALSAAVTDGAVYGENSSGRPNLFVSFLGDNKDYIPESNTVTSGSLKDPAAYDFESTTNPTAGRWSKYTQEDRNKDIIFWVGVGVDRLQLLELLASDSSGRAGLTSFEAGFYYDDKVVEPYVPNKADGTPDTAGYTAFIAKQNMTIGGTSNRWDSNYYEVLRAETGLSVQMDPITQEEITLPSNDQILSNTHSDGHDADWKMAYYSIELKEAARNVVSARRFSGQYDSTKKDTPAASGKDGYYYLLMIPFRLKNGGDTDTSASHIRLIRNATHFSMGGGTYGTDPYGQWEKVTSRTPDHELKLMTYFTGDLLLFKEGKNTDPDYQAKLIINQGGNGNNKAALSVNSDPSAYPVKINRSGDSIYKLRSGLGMLVEVEKASGYNVTVTVDYEEKEDSDPSGKRTVHWDLTASYVSTSADGSKRQYTFNLPEFIPPSSATRLVTITVTFGYENRPFSNIYLSEIHQDKDSNITSRKVGNEATVTVDLLKNATDNTFAPADPSAVVSMDSFSPIASSHPTHEPVFRYDESTHTWSADKIPVSHDLGPSVEAQHTIATSESTYFSVDVSVHEDYEAVVQIYNFQDAAYAYGDGSGGNMNYAGSFNVTTGDVENRFNPYGQIVLRHGGTLVFSVPNGDVDVEITYRPAQRYKAKLEVYHATGTEVKDINVAQLIYTEYDSLNTPQRALSGEVYENDSATPSDHSAVKTPGKELPWISLSESDRSLSLGGDTSRTATDWALTTDNALGPKAIMSLLAADTASAQDDLTDSLTALNLSGLTLGDSTNTFTGLRKDLQGTAFEDGDASVLSDYLWEIRQQIKADTAPSGLADTYLKSVASSSGTGTAYQYFDLTPNQIQWYILQCLEAEQLYSKNLQKYREVQQRYLTQKARCDEMLTKPALSGLAVIVPAPKKVMDIAVDPTTFVRSYHGTDYADYLDDMDTYLTAYARYLDDVSAAGTVSGITAPTNAPDFATAVTVSTVEIAPDGDAAAAVSGYAWDTPTVPSNPTDHTIETRENRPVYVALEADSEYELASVQILDEDGNTALSTPVTQVTGYRNVYSFSMPQEDCVVRVTYQKRGTLTVTGTITGCDGVKDNVAKIELYSKNSGFVTPKYNLITNLSGSTVADKTETITDVLRGSLVTVTAKVDTENYEVKVTAITNTGITIISDPVAAPAPDPADGTVYFFPMPTGVGVSKVDIKVEYTKKNQTKNDAHIRTTTDYGLNTAFWYTGTGYVTDYISVAEGTNLTAYITVRPGYYIDTVTAYGASGTYSFTLSGNGYNGGNGAINTSGSNVPGGVGDNRVKLTTTMPDEEYWVMVTFKRGVPPVEPGQTLTLTVKDPDNTTAVDNYAYAMVSDTNTVSDASYTRLPASGSLGKVHAAMQDTQSVPQGKLVTVRFQAAEGYYASAVEVTPSTLGVTPIWETRDPATGESVVTFVMPSASCGVTVAFAKIPAAGEPTYKLQVMEKFSDNRLYDEKNYVNTITADTIQNWWSTSTYAGLTAATNPEMVPPTTMVNATGVAKAGETVTATFKIEDDHWYVKSVALLYPGGVRYLNYTYQSTAADGTKIYETSFAMPPAMSQLVVTYHQGPKPTVEDYDVSLRLIDNDNVKHLSADSTTSVYFDNGATLTGSVSATELKVGGPEVLTSAPLGDDVYRTMQDRGHFHAGETMTLNITRDTAQGYQLEYAIVTPSGIVTLNWLSATKATFVMPNEEITVIVKIIKGDPRQYTVNLILRLPDGSTANINDVGQGSLVLPDGVTGSITGYPTNAIFSTVATPGTQYGLDLYAFPGYYIDRITIDPASSGATANYTGNVGYQTGDFVMPYMDINVNVWFEAGWPDEILYDLTLNVYDTDAGFASDGTHTPKNYAHFQAIGGSVLTPTDNDKVYGSESKTLASKVLDNQTVVVRIQKDTTGTKQYDWDAVVTDQSGNLVSWWRVPGGIAFTAPPSHVTVDVTFKEKTKTSSVNLTLAVNNTSLGSGKLTVFEKSQSLTAPGTLSGLEVGDTVNLDAVVTNPTASHIEAVYAYVDNSDGTAVPIYLLKSGNTYSDCSQLANFLPNGLSGGDLGQFTLPEEADGKTVYVHVKFASGAVDPATQKPVTLWVSGGTGAGNAEAVVTEDSPANSTGTVSATGMNTIYTAVSTTVAKTVTATFAPASGYYISKLEVYDKTGKAVDYEWISMLPGGTVTDPDTWPTPVPGLGISSPSYQPNPQKQIKLEVPLEGVTIHVTYAKDTGKQYKVQVIANNAGGADNDAWLRRPNTAGDPVNPQSKIFYDATAGEWFNLDIEVQAGYRVKSILAVPQGYGIRPSLPLGPLYDQTTGFTMPAGDLVVYVEFEEDKADRKTATLVVVDEPAGSTGTNNDNYATIHSPISGTSANVYVDDTPESVVARPTVDWVTVDYHWDITQSWVKSVKVTNLAGTVTLPFTQVATGVDGHGKITLPMDANDILITVTYAENTDPDLKLPEVILHVIDDSTGNVLKNRTDLAYGQVSCTTNITVPSALGTIPNPNSTGQIAAGDPENTATLTSVAGETATFEAFVASGYYIKSAYVFFEDTSQVVHAAFAANTGTQSDTFAVHPGTNHVYLRVTNKPTTAVEHNVVLTLEGPIDASGTAKMYNNTLVTDRTNVNSYYDKLDQANHGFATVSAASGNKIQIDVTPAPGFVIDYVQITPLGFPLDSSTYHYVLSGNTITFDMPHINVGIKVVLKRGVSTKYNARLHFIPDPQHDDPTSCTLSTMNLATLSWVDGTQKSIQANEQTYHGLDPNAPTLAGGGYAAYTEMEVAEGATVTLQGDTYVDTASGYEEFILSAYVLRGTVLVPLTPSASTGRTAYDGLEGLSGVGNTATFTMPAEDVDVYLVVSAVKPASKWHTVVVIATDEKGTDRNTGDNRGYLWETINPRTDLYAVSKDYPKHVSLAVPETKTDGTPNTFSARPQADTGYEFQLPATATYNTAPYSANLTPKTTVPYSYEEPITRNTAVHMHFISAEKPDLTVELVDRENRNDGSVKQKATVSASGVATLEVESTNSFGAYQIMHGVASGSTVTVKVKPHADYQAVAKVTDGTGAVTLITLTKGSGGTFTGTFAMPSTDSTLTIIFTTGYDAILHLVNNTSTGHLASMWDTMRADAERSNRVAAEIKMEDLPNGDTLVARMDTTLASGEKLTGLLTERGSTSLMTPSSGKDTTDDGHNEATSHYDHTIDRADVEITLVVEANANRYLAAVNTVNAPSTGLATIQNTSQPTLSHADTWTQADGADQVEVRVTVPTGYKAVVTADHVSLSTTLTTSGTVSFTMPANNVQVTVEFVKTEYTLTLRIVGTGTAEVKVAGMTTTLTASGDSMTIPASVPMPAVTTTFAPTDLATAFYRSDNGQAGNINSGDTFTMPEADTVVTVMFKRSGTGVGRPLVVYTREVHGYAGAKHPDNKILLLADDTRTPEQDHSPAWISAEPEDRIRVAFQVAEGYYAQVTAQDSAGNVVAVSQVGTTGNGYALAEMPDRNLTITVTFYKGTLPTTNNEAALRLVEHDGRAGNNAKLTGPGPLSIALAGDETLWLVDPTNPKSDVEKRDTSVSSGHQLRTMAYWDTTSSISKITLAIRDSSGTETPEVELTMNEYSGSISAQSYAPVLSTGEIPVIRVYYGSRFTATMHIQRNGTSGDTTSATDSRLTPETSTGLSPITADGDALINLAGGETIQTTAKPAISGPAPAAGDQRLVGVIRETASGGAVTVPQATGVADRYDFLMPQEDVDFYVIYEKEPADPKDKSYIAKVTFASDSQHAEDATNDVTIRNVTDPSVSKGKYWTAAKGGDTVTVNVTVAPGYQAEILSAKADDTPGTGNFDYYISRTLFLPNAPAGKDATFSMPVNSDATVTVKFTKGYGFTLEMQDSSQKVNTATAEAQVSSVSKSSVSITSTIPSISGGLFTGKEVMNGLNGTEDIYNHITRTYPANGVDTSKPIPTRVLWYSRFTGTKTLLSERESLTLNTTRTNSIGSTQIELDPESMVQADVIEGVYFRDPTRQDDLLAKVQIVGDWSDITGNEVEKIIDTGTKSDGTANPIATTTGSIWTSTMSDQTIQMTLTVAKGYKAKITVLIDNADAAGETDSSKLYLDAKDYAFKLDGSPLVSDGGIYTVEVGYTEATSPTAPYPGSVSDPRHFTFTMPSAIAGNTYLPSDVTVLVEYSYADVVPQPYTPEHVNSDSYSNSPANHTGTDLKPTFLSEGFIYGENRSEYAVIDIPTLLDDDLKLRDSDNYDTAATKDASKKVTYQFYLRTGVDADGNDTFALLTSGVDVDLVPYNEDTLVNKTDPYNYYTTADYHSPVNVTATPQSYTGSQFLLVPKVDGAGNFTANGQILYEMLNDRKNTSTADDGLGSLEKQTDGSYKTRLYVTAQNALGQESEKTEVWIRPCFQLQVNVVSYAPNHITTGTLYRLMTEDELRAAQGLSPTDPVTVDPMNFEHYCVAGVTEPWLEIETYLASSNGDFAMQWRMQNSFLSSDLLGGWDKDYDPGMDLLANVRIDPADKPVYAFQIQKAGNITYTRVNLDLTEGFTLTGTTIQTIDLTTGTKPGYYIDADLAFRVQDQVQLFAGSVLGLDRVKESEKTEIQNFLSGFARYTTTVNQASEVNPGDWFNSIHNPNSLAYWCDLDGNGRITNSDLSILQNNFNWKRTAKSYLWTRVSDSSRVLPFGFGGDKNNGDYQFDLFSLEDLSQPTPLEPDPFWDAVNEDGEEVELPGTYVEADGTLLDQEQVAAWKEMQALEERLSGSSGGHSGSSGGAANRPSSWEDTIGDGESAETPGGEEIVLPDDDQAWLDPIPDLDEGKEPDLPPEEWTDLNGTDPWQEDEEGEDPVS